MKVYDNGEEEAPPDQLAGSAITGDTELLQMLSENPFGVGPPSATNDILSVANQMFGASRDHVDTAYATNLLTAASAPNNRSVGPQMHGASNLHVDPACATNMLFLWNSETDPSM